MAQLKMYRKPQNVLFKNAPDGVTVRTYNGTKEDMQLWLDMCKCGILGPDASEAEFHECITKDIRIDPLKDIYMFELDGKTAATITAVIDRETKLGTVHMVDSFEWARGRGIGSYMMFVVLDRLVSEGMEWIQLSTDDFRIPAIKSYIRQGFLPVNNDGDMEERWSKILSVIGMDEIEMLNPDFTTYKTIQKA